MSNKIESIELETLTVKEINKEILQKISKEKIEDYKSEIEIDEVDEWLLPITKKDSN